jgi:hypothetical protein
MFLFENVNIFDREKLISKAIEIKKKYKATYVVLIHGSAEVVLGTKEFTSDLDIEGDFKGFENATPTKYGPPYDLYTIEKGKVDISISKGLDLNKVFKISEGVYCVKVNELIRSKLELGREKDMLAIARIKEFFGIS